tara:strand:+ start:1616 stop:1867 length:252 start_codon:yes stop_codon:yes gene_type:complete
MAQTIKTFAILSLISPSFWPYSNQKSNHKEEDLFYGLTTFQQSLFGNLLELFRANNMDSKHLEEIKNTNYTLVAQPENNFFSR